MKVEEIGKVLSSLGGGTHGSAYAVIGPDSSSTVKIQVHGGTRAFSSIIQLIFIFMVNLYISITYTQTHQESM